MKTALDLTANLPKNSLETYLSLYFENKYLEEKHLADIKTVLKESTYNLIERSQV